MTIEKANSEKSSISIERKLAFRRSDEEEPRLLLTISIYILWNMKMNLGREVDECVIMR